MEEIATSGSPVDLVPEPSTSGETSEPEVTLRNQERSNTRSNLSLSTETTKLGFVRRFRRLSTQLGSNSKVNSSTASPQDSSNPVPSSNSPGRRSGSDFEQLAPGLSLGPLTTTQSCLDVSMQQPSIPKNAAFSKSTSELDTIGEMKTKGSKNVRNKKFEQQKKLSISSPNMRRSITNEEDNAVITPHSNQRRNEKFHKIFKNVPESEKVLNYYSCALVSEILLQGVLYISDNYFGFYSNVFGHITKILIPVKKITDIKKQNTAMVIPNAIKILADTKKFTFTSLMSRDATFRLMLKVWDHAIKPTPIDPTSSSMESITSSNDSDRNSSQSGSTCSNDNSVLPNPPITGPLPITGVFQMCMGVLGVVFPVQKLMFGLKSSAISLSRLPRTTLFLAMSTVLLIFLYMSAAFLIFRLNTLHYRYGIYASDGADNEGQNYHEVYRWQNQMHTAAVGSLKDTLANQIEQLVEVRKSLETLKMVASEGGGTFQETLVDVAGVSASAT